MTVNSANHSLDLWTLLYLTTHQPLTFKCLNSESQSTDLQAFLYLANHQPLTFKCQHLQYPDHSGDIFCRHNFMLIFTQQCIRFKHLELITSRIYVMSAINTTHATDTASILTNLYLHLHAASLPTPQYILPVGHTPYAKPPFFINASLITHSLKKYVLRSK